MVAMPSNLLMLLSAVLSISGAYGRKPKLPLDGRQPDHIKQVLKRTYDFIVVGAGIGGSVMAARLAEDFSVLLIEAGGSDKDYPSHAIPMLAPQLLTSPAPELDWEYWTTNQTGLNGRRFPYARGRALGGSSTVNFMIVNKGSMEEWDRIAESAGDSGWNWHNMNASGYFKKFERLVDPMDGHNITDQCEEKTHGLKGRIRTSLPNYNYTSDSYLIKTALSTSVNSTHGFEYARDINSGYSNMGIGYIPMSLGGGVRSSASAGYLWNEHHPHVLRRDGPDVLINAMVTRLTFDHGTRTVSGVEWQSNSTSPSYRIRAKKEVILAAGAINTPQILMLSGIGPADALDKLNIPLVADLPVGLDLVDHPMLIENWELKSEYLHNLPFDTYDADLGNFTVIRNDLGLWSGKHSGRSSQGLGGVIGWSRFDDLVTPDTDPSAGGRTPHVETAFTAGWIDSELPGQPGHGIPDITHKYLSVIHVVVSPASRGSVTLESSSPWKAPLIDPGFLEDKDGIDFNMFKDSIRKIRHFMEQAPIGDLFFKYAPEKAPLDDDKTLSSFICNGITTIWHAAGTTPMAKSRGVVDSDLNVKGVHNLRIVDLGVFPWIPAGHPEGYLYIFAERAAVIVRNKYLDAIPYTQRAGKYISESTVGRAYSSSAQSFFKLSNATLARFLELQLASAHAEL